MTHDLNDLPVPPHRDPAGDTLRTALVSHEYLAPDAGAVRAGAAGRTSAFRRRRTVTRAAGCAVLGAGLVVGGFVVPGLLPGGAEVVVQDPAGAPVAAPVEHPMPAQADVQKAYDAYFGAGYGYDDAVRIAQLWQVPNDPGTVKAQAGQALLDGQTLPVAPGPETTVAVETGEQKAVDAFFEAGYDYRDATKLAKLWKSKDTYQTKIDAGQKLLDGQELPFAP